jgi:hypothetical protein
MKFDLTDDEQLPRKYLQFPLFLVRDMFKDKQGTISKMFEYGIYKLSKSIKYDLRNVARQTIYEHYRGELNHQIKQQLTSHDLKYFGSDDDYNGFANDMFEPEDEINELLQAFANDTELESLCVEHHCVRQSLKTLSITGNIGYILERGKAVEKLIQPGEVMPMIGKHTLFNFRDEDKSVFEIAQLLAYIAIRSIIGERKYTKTNKQHITARMFGYKSINEVKKISELHKKYSNRYHIDKTLKALELDWKVCIYDNRTRGLYISISNKLPLQKLVEIAEQKKLSKREKDFNEKKRSIISTALNTTK